MQFDWAAVRKQKAWLEQFDVPEARGLVITLEAIQNAAVEFGEATIVEVFGLVKGEDNAILDANRRS